MNNNIFEDETDNESSYSWDETDSEDEQNDFIYEPEEPSLNKFSIVLCDKYNKLVHGPAPKIMHTHYLTYMRFKELNINEIDGFRIISDTLQLEIAECIYLPSYHCVSIIKTFWLRLVQRTWKRIYKERKVCIARRANPNALKYREIYGKWSYNCENYPQLKGMLSSLSRTSSS
jgi:hypothetical protein